MNKINFKRLAVTFILLFCLSLSSCNITENVFQVPPEVDFSEPQKVQVSFNEHIYDTVVVFSGAKLEVNFCNEKDLVNGAYVSINKQSYKITYSDMVFEGETQTLTDSFLPYIIYEFFSSFENEIILDSYDKEKDCYSVNSNINSYFITLEAYEKNDNISYSMEIK